MGENNYLISALDTISIENNYAEIKAIKI